MVTQLVFAMETELADMLGYPFQPLQCIPKTQSGALKIWALNHLYTFCTIRYIPQLRLP